VAVLRHQPDAPGLHRQRLSAAQPAPEEVGGEHRQHEELQQIAPPAFDLQRAGGELEHPGREEGHPEQQE